MKNIIFYIAFICLLTVSLSAQEDHIKFEKEAWSDILKKAAVENKVIFMDAYTTWCGPCKKMSRDVFTTKEVADYFNSNFINVKMDMEKGEGIGLSQEYNVIAYPTLLFIGADGNIVHRAVGYHNTDKFLELGETANTPGSNLAALKARYDFGDRSAQFLYDYTFATSEAMTGTHPKIAEEYLSTQTDWNTERNLSFLFRFLESTDGKMFDYFIANKERYVGIFGENPIARKLQYLINNSISENDNSEADAITRVGNLYKKVYPEKAEEMTSEFSMMYFLRAGDFDKYIATTKKHFSTYGTENWESLNESAWNFYEFADSKKDIKQAIKWAKKSVALNKNFYNTDTLAALYYKLGKKGKATKAAELAIALAKSSGDDSSTTQELLQEIQKL